MAIAPVVFATPVGGANGATTAAIDTTGANLIVILVAYQVTITVSDSKSNVWTPLTESSNTNKARIYYCLAPTAGSGHTFTVAGASSFSTINVGAYSGVALSLPFDVENGATATGSALSTGSVTPSVDNELIVAVVSTNSGNTYTVNAGFTIQSQLASSGGVRSGTAFADLIETVATAKNPQFGWTGFSFAAARIATFKADSGPSAVSGFRSLLGVGI